jgi:hypothetical protein
MTLPKTEPAMPKSGLQSAAEFYANRQPVAIPMSQHRIDQCALSMEYVMDAAESSTLPEQLVTRAKRILSQSHGFDGPPPVRCEACEG